MPFNPHLLDLPRECDTLSQRHEKCESQGDESNFRATHEITWQAWETSGVLCPYFGILAYLMMTGGSAKIAKTFYFSELSRQLRKYLASHLLLHDRMTFLICCSLGWFEKGAK